MTVLADLIVRVSGDITSLQSDMKRAGDVIGEAGRNISAAGGTLTRNVTLPIAGAATAVVAFATDFNSGMANVASLGSEAQEALAGWTPQIQDIAIGVGKSTGDMTDGLYQVVSAFGVTDDSMAILDTNARAAAAGLATTSEAIALTSALTKGYGDTSGEAVQQAADLALKTVQLGQTTFPELAASIGRVVPLAAQLGVSQEELFATMATGTGVTGNAAEVSTQLRGVLQSLMAPTEDMKKLMDDYGFANGEAMLATWGLDTSIEEIIARAEQTGTPLQKYIGSIEGQTLAMALAGPQADTYAKKLEAMSGAAGATDEAFAAQTDGVNAFGFQMKQLGVELQTVAQDLGQQLIPVLSNLLTQARPIIDWVKQMVQRFTELDPQMQMIILGGIALAAALGPILLILGPLVTGIGALVGIIGALISPVGLVIALVAGLALAWKTNFLGIQDHVAAFVEWVTPYLQAFVEWLGGAFDTVMGALAGMWERHGAAVMAAWESIQGAAMAFVALVQPIIEKFITWLGETWDATLAAVTEFWNTHGETIMGVASAIWEGIQLLIGGALENVKLVFSAFKQLFEGDFRGFGETLREIWDNAWQTIKDVVATLWDAIGPLLAQLWTNIKTWFVTTDWKQLGLDIINGIVVGLNNAAHAVTDFLLDLAKDALDVIKGFFGIESPSTVMALQVGQPLAEGVAVGWEQALNHIDFGAQLAASVEPASIRETAAPNANSRLGIVPLPLPGDNKEAISITVRADEWRAAMIRFGV